MKLTTAICTTCILIGLLCLTPWYSTSAPEEVDPNYTSLRSAKLSGDVSTVTQLALNRDAGSLVFGRGDFYVLEPVMGHVVGAVFVGEGEFRLAPGYELEKRNLSIFTGEPRLTESFTELVLHFTDGTYEEIVKAAGPRKEPRNSRAQSILDSRLELLRKGRPTANANIAGSLLNRNLPLRLLADLYDPSHAGFFNAFIKGKRFQNLMFRVDPRGVPPFEPEEVVLACFDEADLGVWSAFHLDKHYDSAVADEDPRLFDIENQRIEARIKGSDLTAKVQTTIKTLQDGPRVLNFDLYPTLRVSRVAWNGGELKFIQEDKDNDPDLAIIFPEPLKKGTYRIDFEYSGGNALHNDGSGNFTLVARDNWYPSTNFGDRATYDMTFTLAKDLTMVASGKPTETREEANQQVTRWVSDVPIAVAGFNFGKFKKSAARSAKSQYDFEAYANREIPDDLKEIADLLVGNLNTTSLMEKARAEAEVSVDVYNNYYGALPYGRLAMTQQTAPDFGQAWPMLVYMPLTSFLDSTMRFQLGLSTEADFFRMVGPHEVAHQWWGHIVGWKTYRDQWMSEGFADFSASLFLNAVYGEDKFIQFWKNERERLVEKNRFGVRPVDVGSVTMGYRIDSARTQGTGRNMLYPKGAYILHMIRMMMFDPRKGGDQAFITMMRDFVKTHFNQNVSTEDFQKIVDKHMTPSMDLDGNHRMDWFFDQFVYGSEVPRYKLDYTLQASGEKTIVKMRGTQSEVSDEFRMVLPIYAETQDRKLVRLGNMTLIGNTSQEGTVQLPFKPRRVLFCAFEDVLANFDGR